MMPIMMVLLVKGKGNSTLYGAGLAIIGHVLFLKGTPSLPQRWRLWKLYFIT